MKIWFPVIQVGTGTDVFTARLSEALSRRGIETEITWFQKYFELAPFLLSHVSVPQGVDIIHANSWYGFAFRRRGTPLVVTEHHCVFDSSFRPFKNSLQHLYHQLIIKKFETASFAKAEAVTAVSLFTAASLARSAKLNNARLIYNWVDTTKFIPAETRGVNSENKTFRLLYVGNLSKRKGVDLLAPIMQDLGEGFELRFTSGLRKDKGGEFPDNMMPLGRMTEPELIHEFQQCDALLFPSRFEGFGYAALEAMACGKPVVATNATSLPEIIEDGVSGFLCQTDDVEAFAHSCRQLADNRELCRKMGAAGRKRAEEIFSEEKIIAQYIELYEEVLRKNYLRR